MQLPVLNTEGEKVGEMAVDDAVFAITPNLAVLHQAFVAQRANQRSAQARVDRKAALPHLCPEHGKGRKENWGPGYHCPTQLEDGSYCKWRWSPEPVAQVHPRDEN